jgi:hypothetical protein
MVLALGGWLVAIAPREAHDVELGPLAATSGIGPHPTSSQRSGAPAQPPSQASVPGTPPLILSVLPGLGGSWSRARWGSGPLFLGWQLRQGIGSDVEAVRGQPTGPDRERISIGGSPAGRTNVVELNRDEEQRITRSFQNYRRLRLDTVTYNSSPAVAWEFEWNDGGTMRRAVRLMWRFNDTDYFIYMSASATSWGLHRKRHSKIS